MREIVVVGHDLGSKNYGWAVVRGRLNKSQISLHVIENGMLLNPIQQLKRRKQLDRHLQKYLEECQSHISQHKAEFLIAERFQSRGLRGLTVELVGLMLGALWWDLELPKQLVAAVTWKNEIKKWGVDLDKVYKKSRTQRHQVDAMFLAIYAIIKILKAPRQKLKLGHLIKDLESTSKARLINRRR